MGKIEAGAARELYRPKREPSGGVLPTGAPPATGEDREMSVAGFVIAWVIVLLFCLGVYALVGVGVWLLFW